VSRFPKLARVEQRFDPKAIDDPGAHLLGALRAWDSGKIDLDGKEIAITAGSRGIADIRTIFQALLDFLVDRGARPFLVPAMGSHGGATAEGQRALLKSYGLDERTLGAPIRSSMETVEVGRTAEGLPVFCDRIAASAHGIVVVNRIKDHTDFEGKYESGLVKMMVIGLGKQQGALAIHRFGIRGFKEEMARCAEVVLSRVPILCGIGIVENAYGKPAIIEVIDRTRILEREPALLAAAKQLRPRLLLDELDVLVVCEMGKDISGTGMDTNVIGRRMIFGEREPDRPKIKRVAVLSLTDHSQGNAVGIGLADICTRRLVSKIDFLQTTVNTITATSIERVKIPLTADTDRDAIEIALNTCWVPDRRMVKLAAIRNTRSLDAIWLSEGILPAIQERTDIRVIDPPREMAFDPSGVFVM